MPRLPQLTKGRAWKLQVVERLRVRGKECWGCCYWPDRLIKITRSTERNGLERSVLSHELIHRICPWMDEEAVLSLEQAVEDELDRNRSQLVALRKAITRSCPWMRHDAVEFMAAELDEAIDMVDKLFQ